MHRIGSGGRWVAVLVLALLGAAPLPVRAQQEIMHADLPFGTVPGDEVTLTGTVGASCDPGTAEVGFSTLSDDAFAQRMDSDRSPLTGRETVLHRPTAGPGESFAVDIVVPDPGVPEPVFYAICRYTDDFGDAVWIGSSGSFPFDGGVVIPTPSPTINRPPVAAADSYTADPGETLRVAAPGVLGNDDDPDGDAIVAVLGARSATMAAAARFWPNGALQVDADEPGMLCLEYVARDPSRAVSALVTAVVSVGDVDDPAAVVEEGRCRAPTLEDDLFDFVVEEGEGELSDEGIALAPVLPLSDRAGSIATTAVGGALADVLAGHLPAGARCTVSSCLWGYFLPPYFNCNQNVVRISFGRSRYGSITTYGYIRKGLADYVKVRGLYYQDGQLIHTTGWETKYFGGTHYNSWNSVKMHFQFPNPQSIYRTGFQAQWYQAKSWAKDRQIAATNGTGPVPLECTAGP